MLHINDELETLRTNIISMQHATSLRTRACDVSMSVERLNLQGEVSSSMIMACSRSR